MTFKNNNTGNTFCPVIIVMLVVSMMAAPSTLQAQVKFGLATAMSTNHIDPGEVVRYNIDDSIRYTINRAVPVWHVGGFLHLQARRVFLRSSLLLGGARMDHDKNDLLNDENDYTNQRDFKWQLDMPIELGYDFGILTAGGGIIFSNMLTPEKNNFFFTDSWSQLINDQQYGYKFTLGLDFDWQARLELSYSYYENVSGLVVIDDVVDYDFRLRRHFLMASFSWNFIREGWE